MVPIVFVILATLLLVNTFATALGISLFGVGTTLVGALFYAVFLRRKYVEAPAVLQSGE